MKNPLKWFVRPEAKPQEPDLLSLRELLFGDIPTREWSAASATTQQQEPWRWFEQAHVAVRQGEPERAQGPLRQVLATTALESRQYLQAWQALRELGIQPTAAEAKQVLGVVVEVALPGGLDVLAAYADGSARYLNHSGKVIVWEGASDTVAALVHELLTAGQQVADRIGPWEGARPPRPTGDAARINLLTPSGLHFGEAPFGVLWNDALAHPVLAAAQALMIALMEHARPGSSGVVQ
jgi:hypothetical protein